MEDVVHCTVPKIEAVFPSSILKNIAYKNLWKLQKQINKKCWCFFFLLNQSRRAKCLMETDLQNNL